MTLPGWTREPLVHFLALGALLYVGLTWGGTPVDPASRVISVGQQEQAQIALTFERTMGRAPTDAELDSAIERYVRDEVLYREALRLGLDQDDAVVRQRLVAKMDMSAAVAAETAQPNESTLRAFFEDNAQLYGGETAASFEQAFFSSVEAARGALGSTVEGEAISLPSRVTDMPLREVQSRFGEDFALALAELEPSDDWQGPIRSGFGWHLVRFERRSSEPSDFEAMRGRVENDWRSEAMGERKRQAFEVLRSAYRVEIDR
ncbi:MAG: peptidyl-prolyl cis-trans isomerase [Erythrobacter sp.]